MFLVHLLGEKSCVKAGIHHLGYVILLVSGKVGNVKYRILVPLDVVSFLEDYAEEADVDVGRVLVNEPSQPANLAVSHDVEIQISVIQPSFC